MQQRTELGALGVLSILSGVLQMVGAAVLFGVIPISVNGFEPGAATTSFVSFALFVIGVTTVAVGLGVFARLDWSWGMGISAASLAILLAIYATVAASFSGVVFLSALLLVALSMAMLAYLYMADVRAALGHEHGYRAGTGSMGRPTHA